MKIKLVLLITISVFGVYVASSCARMCPKYPSEAKSYLPVALHEITYESGEERMLLRCSEILYNGGGEQTKFGEKYDCNAFLLMEFSDSLGNKILYMNSFSSWKTKEWENHDLSIEWEMKDLHFYNYYSIGKDGLIRGFTEKLEDWTSALGENYTEVYHVEEESGISFYFCENWGVVQIETNTGKIWTLRLSSMT